MHLYVRIILLWIILWGIPYISLKIQWKCYKASGGHINYKYWKYDKAAYEIFIAIFSIVKGKTRILVHPGQSNPYKPHILYLQHRSSLQE